ncbi:MAG: FMN-binding protein, partial [Eubacteriales bacterium]
AIQMENLAPLTELYAGKAGDEVVGYVGMASPTGYGGPVQVIAGVDAQGRVTGVAVGGSGTGFAETAGLGAKAQDPAFMNQFSGKQTPLRAVKSAADRGDNTIDAITAATITSNTVTGAVNNIASKVNAYLNPDDGAPAEGTTYTASAQGFAGPVAVFVTVKDDGAITGLQIGDEKFNETENYGAGAKESGFIKQFVGKTLPLTIEDIDAISGATITTKAVVEALNKAIEDKVVVAPAAPEGTRYTASEKGFAGPVAVFVTVKDDGTITALEIGDEQFKETENYGAGAKESGFKKQFVGKTLPVAIEDIDAISGATITTKAVIAAINRAYEEKLVDGTAPQQAGTPEAAEEAQTPAVPDGARTETSSSKGYGGPVAVTIWLNDDDTIAAMTIGDADFAETQGFGSRAQEPEFINSFIGKKVPLADGDVDVLAGATVTSEAVIKAVNKAAEKLGIAAEAAAPEASAEPVQEPATQTDGKTATSSSKGYAGPVAVTIILNDDNTIATLSVGDADFAETEGLGSRTKDVEFTDRFIGKSVPLADGDVDVLAGATVTSEAVIKAVNKAAESLGITAKETDVESSAPAQEAKASAQGYKGPIAVTLTLNADYTIKTLVIGDENFTETVHIGSKVLDKEFAEQFIGKKVPLKEGDADTITNATVSSLAVIEAINLAAAQLMK